MPIKEILPVRNALEALGIFNRLSTIEQKDFWTVRTVRTVNGSAPNDLGNIDISAGGGDLTESEADALFIRLNGSNTPVTGDIIFPVTGKIMTDSSSVSWRLTIDTTGHLVTT